MLSFDQRLRLCSVEERLEKKCAAADRAKLERQSLQAKIQQEARLELREERAQRRLDNVEEKKNAAEATAEEAQRRGRFALASEVEYWRYRGRNVGEPRSEADWLPADPAEIARGPARGPRRCAEGGICAARSCGGTEA